MQGHEYDGRRRLRAFDSLRMIVGDDRCDRCDLQHLLQILLAEPGDRRYAHRASVAKAVVGLGIFLFQPHAEIHAVAGEGIPAAVLFHRFDQRLFHRLLVGVNAAVHQRFRYRQRHNAVVCKLGPL